MGKIYESSLELVGGTPLLRLSRYAGRAGIVDVEILAKLEYLNPAGSVKDRTALAMIEDAERKGILKPGATIIEPTSGNTGIGLAAAAAVKGYQTILTLPDTMSMERRSLLGAYGARLVLTEGAAGMNGAIARAEELQKEIPGSVILGQFENAANSQVHREFTGPEIWEQTDGKVDIFVAGVGTGGTVTGVGEYLKSRNPAVRVVAVEPAASPVLSMKAFGRQQGIGAKEDPGTYGAAGASEDLRRNGAAGTLEDGGKHGVSSVNLIQGIGAGFVPEVLNTEVYDEVVTVENEDAFAEGRALARSEGILAGISSGAALKAAGILAARPENRGKMIVVLLPDSGDRYLSTPMFAQ